ncbi:c-type cytochrome [Chitinimonas sp. BJB300]|uniref:c-type cytochrome n=1 Tax=Chitinimonas sp. BJB300 TaxID=1559339 RepID=UPI000C0E3D55|nr:cytochrome c [Chitinimonas sp. BJB300]PHV13397.1 cytochrome C [Chitinimonas sp. BJB300]TSJ89717.1 cytochrome c [Chitinimonas sp. BJB300]
MNARCLSLLVIAGTTLATQAADLNAGKAKSEQVCASCHNVDGNSTNPQYPVLAGQHGDYIARALHDYQTGVRTNAIMAGMAKPLTKDDIANLADWFASQQSGLNMKR